MVIKKDNMIIVYAITKNGDGFVTKIGEYESWEDIQINIATFARDVVISFEEEQENGN